MRAGGAAAEGAGAEAAVPRSAEETVGLCGCASLIGEDACVGRLATLVGRCPGAGARTAFAVGADAADPGRGRAVLLLMLPSPSGEGRAGRESRCARMLALAGRVAVVVVFSPAAWRLRAASRSATLRSYSSQIRSSGSSAGAARQSTVLQSTAAATHSMGATQACSSRRSDPARRR